MSKTSNRPNREEIKAQQKKRNDNKESFVIDKKLRD